MTASTNSASKQIHKIKHSLIVSLKQITSHSSAGTEPDWNPGFVGVYDLKHRIDGLDKSMVVLCISNQIPATSFQEFEW